MEQWSKVADVTDYFHTNSDDIKAILDILGGTPDDTIPVLASLAIEGIKEAAAEWADTAPLSL